MDEDVIVQNRSPFDYDFTRFIFGFDDVSWDEAFDMHCLEPVAYDQFTLICDSKNVPKKNVTHISSLLLGGIDTDINSSVSISLIN